MVRLLKYLQFRDYKSKLLKSLEDDDGQADSGMCVHCSTSVRIIMQLRNKLLCSVVAGGAQRRQRLAQDFLVWMDQTGDLLSLAERQEVDPVKLERMEVRGRPDLTVASL